MCPTVATRTLTCAISPELYQCYRDLIPSGETVNTHLAHLVETYVSAELAAVPFFECSHPRASRTWHDQILRCGICGRNI